MLGGSADGSLPNLQIKYTEDERRIFQPILDIYDPDNTAPARALMLKLSREQLPRLKAYKDDYEKILLARFLGPSSDNDPDVAQAAIEVASPPVFQHSGQIPSPKSLDIFRPPTPEERSSSLPQDTQPQPFSASAQKRRPKAKGCCQLL